MQAWRTERNVRPVNAQGALSLIRCKPSDLKETCGPYERCSRFVSAFTDRTAEMRTESVQVYWTCVYTFNKIPKNGVDTPKAKSQTYISPVLELLFFPLLLSCFFFFFYYSSPYQILISMLMFIWSAKENLRLFKSYFAK